jgi:membrane protease YdiL (CAAX protease family)
MESDLPLAETRAKQTTLLAVLWTVTLFVSILPDIFFRELTGSAPSWLFWAKIGLLGLCILLSFAWQAIRPIRLYFVVLLVLNLANWVIGLIQQVPQWQAWFSSTSFMVVLAETQILRFGVALVMIATMLILLRRRSAFFLVKGQLDARAEPVRFLFDRPISWRRFGLILSVAISLGTLTFLVIVGRPSLGSLLGALPLLPAVLFFAAMNAFSEEMSYRAAPLATLQAKVNKGQALLATAAYFGIWHYYGVPYGVIGVVMAGILGWLLGKSMLETRGFFWAWFIHFLQDVMIFSFLAIGAVAAGGGK